MQWSLPEANSEGEREKSALEKGQEREEGRKKEIKKSSIPSPGFF